MKSTAPTKQPVNPTARRAVQIKPTGLDAELNLLAQQLGVTLKELAPLLQLSESTLHRLRQQTTLTGPTAERVALLRAIVEHGMRVYAGDQPALWDWLRYPLGGLDGRTPLQTLTSIAGFTQVDDILGRIEHGIFFNSLIPPVYMLVYRLLQGAYRHEPLSGQGAALYGGRWNPKGFSLLYTTESPALSLVEVLVHINPKRIPCYYLVTIEVPDPVRFYRTEELPTDWRLSGSVQPLPSQTFLLSWLREPDSLVVAVPSALVPIMTNYLINPRHALFAACKVIGSELFDIDERLYDSSRRAI